WGVVMALPERPWVEKLFAPFDYPFKFKSIQELPALLDWLLDNEKEARRQLQPIRAMIADKHASTRWDEAIEGVVADVHRHNERFEELYTFREDVLEMLGKWDDVTMTRAVQLGRIGNDTRPMRRQLFTNYLGWRSVRDLDTHTTAVPTFRRQ